MTRAILINWRKYTPYGDEFYGPMLDFQIETLRKYKNEYDTAYFLDSNWNIDPKKVEGLNIQIIKVDPHLRYYDVYKKVLPEIVEDLVLFLDNDMVINKPGIIRETFDLLIDDNDLFPSKETQYDVVSILDTIGEYKTNKLARGNKFCPYWFATRKSLLMEYLGIDWGPDMPYCETLGHLTEAMLKDNISVCEWEEDKTDFPTKQLGYYHVRAGSTPAYLLAEKHYGNPETYWSYLKNQPKTEYLRQCEWYKIMGGDPSEIINDSSTI